MTRRALVCLLVLAFAPIARGDDFPKPIDTEPDKTPTMPAEQAASGFKVPPGFKVTVFASEPEVRNPIAMAWDARGRLWIAENYTYAERATRFDLRFRDRVVILEDSDGDGRHDKRTIFTDDVQVLTSVEVGTGGAWLLCPPQLLFVPDADGDDRPDGPARVVLDGFTVPPENYHNFANGLRWGPDGWLYGRCGASSPGKIGVPGCAESDRVPLAGGLWRFDPRSKRFEALTHGTTNPWGHDWDALGEAFFINTVNGHLWHAIPGAHLVRPHTIDPNPRAYEAIDQHADHYHWDNAKDWTDSRKVTGEHDRRGGGHAHSGMLIYQGDNWPAEDRGKLVTLNLHGRRANVERLERLGTGFVGKHEPDRFFASDPKYRGIDLATGPDGGVFVLDWNDAGECHESNGVLRSTGRVYKFTYGDPKKPTVGDLAKLGAKSLVGLLRHPNDWYARMARRQLIDRNLGEEVAGDLESMAASERDPVIQLRALWTLHALGRLDPSILRDLLHHNHESLRAWAIRLLTDGMPIDTVDGRRPGPDVEIADDLLAEFARMAGSDPSGLVRLTLASTLQRLPVSRRARLAAPLLARTEDAEDHNQPLLIWYALIPLADLDPSEFARLADGCALRTTRRFIARRLAETMDRDPSPVGSLVALADASTDPSYRADLLQGFAEGLRGWRKAPKPSGWDALVEKLAKGADPAIEARVRDLNVLFGDGRALEEVKRLALDDKADLETRRSALRTLIEDRPPDLRAICEKLLRVRFLNVTAAKGLTLFDDPAIGKSLVASYRSFHPSERPMIVDALVARPAFARALLDAMASGSIPKSDLSAYQARQVRSLGVAELSKKLSETWGEVRETSADRRAAMAKVKATLTTEAIAEADRSRGRVLYNRLCASCHTLYGQGGAIGPDLTGSGRDNVDYLLENILDPGATVNADFRMSVVATRDGRVLNGLVRNKTDRTITLQSQNEAIVLERSEIEQIQPSALSLMPDGLVDPLAPGEVRDLFAYLMSRSQAPLPEGSK